MQHRFMVVLTILLGLVLSTVSAAQPPEKRPPRKGPPGKENGKGSIPQQSAHPEDKAAFGTEPETPAPTTPAGMKHLGGRWYLNGKTYLYRDAQRFVEPFGYTGDSNKDGIPDLVVSHDDSFIILHSQNLPNHPHAPFPNSRNPNTITAQKLKLKIPITPQKGTSITRVPMGPIAVAVNGVVFFNPFEAGGMNAVQGYRSEWLDSCCGHPQQHGVYHYHKYPSCVKSPFPDDGEQHSPPIGFAWDGYPIYGPYEAKGVEAKDLKDNQMLDVCNGHFDPERGYHYHVTPGKFPYVLGGYAGVPERSNGHGIGRDPVGAIRDNATGSSRYDQALVVTPATIARGKTVVLHIAGKTNTLPAELPSRVLVGPYVGSQLRRDGNDITVSVSVPEDASCCRHDVHLEYHRSGQTVVAKQNEAVRVIK
ncbi:MAG: YHYH protein [Gemmatales bacterium]